MIRSSQHEFVPKSSCQANLISSFDQATGLVDCRDTVDIVCLGFSKAFDNILVMF